jgi:hypothetical protein
MRHESDRWGPGPSILATDTLAALRSALEETPLIVEHRFYRGASSPERRVFENADDLEAYLRERTRPGDSVWIWRFDSLCRDDNALARGKGARLGRRGPGGGRVLAAG